MENLIIKKLNKKKEVIQQSQSKLQQNSGINGISFAMELNNDSILYQAF